MKIQIKSKYSGKVLFEHNCKDNTLTLTVIQACRRGADLRCADLSGAYLRGADLSGADLRGADLRDVYLRCADLSGAKYADFEINKTPILISNLKYEIIIFDNHLKIGCELHTHSQWSKFTQKKIIEMGGKDALKWWKQWKEPILQMCKT